MRYAGVRSGDLDIRFFRSGKPKDTLTNRYEQDRLKTSYGKKLGREEYAERKLSETPVGAKGE